MAHHSLIKPRFGAQSRALVADSYQTARSVLAAQLRALGVDHVTQCGRAGEVRQHMAARSYDVLVCEHSLSDGTQGQDLIDELRRSGHLGLGTVVLMLSSLASYQVVAQVAESALDGFVIKPYAVGDLEDRVLRAFARKESLKDILQALDEQRYGDSLALCEQRFRARGPHWTSAARLGAELAIRQGQMALASAMFEAVIADNAVPWAKLGIARVLEAGDRKAEALSTVEGLLASEPSYADAYDVMGRIHAEQGQFGAAIHAYRQAVKITPHSVARAQKFGILCHYAGEADEATAALEHAIAVGSASPHFDHQTLLLLSVCRYRSSDLDGLQACRAHLDTALDNPAIDGLRRERLQRMQALAVGFERLLGGDTPGASASAADVARALMAPPFDAEAATNLLALVSAAAAAGGALPQAAGWVREAGLRFCVSKHATELLVRACDGMPAFADLLRTAHAEISEATRQALSEGLAGRHRQAAETLVGWAERTLNTKLLEVAEATLTRYQGRIAGAEELQARCVALAERNGRALRQRLLAEAGGETPPGGVWLP
ncbi:response regulator [Rubrivivax sp. RP6-9]|uniref:response regulator n=1 Tax=Rubrivivax sp. RP6-9 TaxID=3415750 RepID=UPI003CC68317